MFDLLELSAQIAREGRGGGGYRVQQTINDEGGREGGEIIFT
jgi:hypothetical protein